MPYSLREVSDVIESLWPIAGAEGWDASGLIAGHPDDSVSRVLLAVDAVADTASEALDIGADLLLVHHPLLLRGVTTVAADRYKGSILTRLIRGNCALLAAHTNADVVSDGTSGVLATLLGLTNITPLVPSADGETGIGRAGRLPEPRTLGHLAHSLAKILPATATGIRVSGDYDSIIESVALCGGAGDSLLSTDAVTRADVYVTSDLRHHPASEAREQAGLGHGPALIDVSHWASEWLWLDVAAAQLRERLPDLTVQVSDIRTDPWDFVVTQ
ncbi:Nif3-like dinuclear metal center hexameric protein [Mycetocola zhadangensis]|uniref:GTP cyclohydrolase 1 type 2 homolog n=1 Tax=Mycetocola zhadangensis TaxID=1164595 RepID=A0A3L7J9A4_9MICO|nr:Nif3-like dinuclear metal center hexameric protein [Mycetocola zhadangensis]RLQ86041.1 Nif3-like dinuclear metal center hexameric protein [Mycetocola zhadangensis]GGE87887.1 GTP cyclohydrolase 1 type 2 [Mycetocola zhadangensis]